MEGERFCLWFAFWGVEVAVARPFVLFTSETRGFSFIAFEVPNSGLRSAKFQLRVVICYELATLVSTEFYVPDCLTYHVLQPDLTLGALALFHFTLAPKSDILA